MNNLTNIIDNYNQVTKSIKRTVKKNISMQVWNILLSIIILSWSFITIFLFMGFVVIISNSGVFPGGILGLMLLFFVIGLSMVWVFYKILNLKIFKIIENITTGPFLIKIESIISDIVALHMKILEDIEGVQDIDSILDKIGTIRILQRDLYKMRLFVWIFARRNNHQFKEAIKESLLWCMQILTGLRSDLALRLTEHRSTLEQAKSEVSTHIHGSEALNQVSELQKQRLDQQIAQFEELQRVLVKV